MLHVFRRHAYTWLTRVFLILLGVVFAVYFGGVGGYFLQAKPVASVDCRQLLFGLITLPGCHNIYSDDIDKEVSNLRKVMINRYGENAPEMIKNANLRQMAVEQLIEQQLILREGQRLGLRISDADLAKEIEMQSAFQEDGHFSVTRYDEILRSNGIQTADFENETRDQILSNTLREMVADAVDVSSVEARQEFNRFAENLTLSYVEFPSANFAASIHPTDAEVAKFYNDNKELFHQPDQAQIIFIRYDPTAVAANTPPSDADIEKYYEDNLQSRFTHPDEVRAQHILIQVPEDADAQERAAAKAKAEDILKKLQAGADFAKLAAQYSDDPGTRDKGGDLGYFGRNEMIKPFADAAFRLKPGQMAVVESSFGYHVIRVEDDRKAHVDTLVEARPKIIATLKEKAGMQAARDDADQDLTAALEGRNLTELAKKHGLVAVTTPYFSSEDTVKGAEDDPKLAKAVLALDKGDIRVMTNGPVPYLVKVLDHKAAHIPPLSEIKDQVRQRLIQMTAETKAHEAAAATLKQIKTASDFDVVAESQHLEVHTTPEFARATRSVPDIGEFSEVTEAAAAIAKVPGVIDRVMDNGGNSYIFKVVSRTPPTNEEWQKQQAMFTDQMLQQRRAIAWQNFVNHLKRATPVTVNTELLGQSSNNEPM